MEDYCDATFDICLFSVQEMEMYGAEKIDRRFSTMRWFHHNLKSLCLCFQVC